MEKEASERILGSFNDLEAVRGYKILDTSVFRPPHIHPYSHGRGHFSQEYEGIRREYGIDENNKDMCRSVREFVEEFMFSYLDRLFGFVEENPVYITNDVVDELVAFKKSAKIGLAKLCSVPKSKRTHSHKERIRLVRRELEYATALCEGNESFVVKMARKGGIFRNGSLNGTRVNGFSNAVDYLEERKNKRDQNTTRTDEGLIVTAFRYSMENVAPVTIISNDKKDFRPQSEELIKGIYDPEDIDIRLNAVSGFRKAEGARVQVFRITLFGLERYFDSQKYLGLLRRSRGAA